MDGDRESSVVNGEIVNLSDGCSRKSHRERKRFFGVSRGSLVEIDACLDVVVKLKYITLDELKNFGDTIMRTFQMLSKMIGPLDPGTENL